jgi:AraC-like DNA-binding protein
VNQPDTDFKLISLNFDPAILRADSAGGEAEQYLLPFTCQTDQFPHHIPRSASLSARALELMLQVHNELPPASRLSRLAVMTYLKMLLLLLCKHYSEHVESRTTFDCNRHSIERLAPLFEFLEAHLERPIAVGEAAHICAMSGSHFMSFFKKATGQSFVAYLNSFRVAKAQALLSTTNDPIAEISAQLAFCSQSYFGKVFHSLVGMTPLAYRERFRSKSQATHGTEESGPLSGLHRDFRPQLGIVDAAGSSPG